MPPGIEDRNADVWEPLLAMADAAGGDWPRVARVAAVALLQEDREKSPSLGIQLLADLQKVFGDQKHLSTDTILHELHAMDESPWGDLRGRPLDSRGLSWRLRPYGVKPVTLRMGDSTPKGYRAEDLHDAWVRYLGPSPEESATSATSATPAVSVSDVADVADVADLRATEREAVVL